MRTAKFLLLIACCSLFVFSCKDEPEINPNDIVSPYYFQMVVDGDTVTYQEDINNYGNIVGDFYGGQTAEGYQYAPFTCIASAEAVANPNPSTLPQSGAVAFLANTQDQQTNYSDYAGLVSTGEVGIGWMASSAADTGVAGGYISYWDAAGTEWTTNGGDQTGSTFTITEYADFTDETRIPNTRKLVAATFECKLYDNTGNSKTITGGKVRGRLIIW